MDSILSQIANEFNLKPFQVINTVKLIDDGNTIPFIARYRKEMTGELNDQVLRELHERLVYLRNLEEKRNDTMRLIEEQGKLTDEVREALKKAATLQEIEDIYRPYRPKRKTRASIAREKGLAPLADEILAQKQIEGSFEEWLKSYIPEDTGIENAEEAINGAMDIIAEDISDNAMYRKAVRQFFFRHGVLVTRSKKEEDSVYRMYYDFSEPVAKIAGHRILAINRGEKEDFLKVSIEVPEQEITTYLKSKVVRTPKAITSTYVEKAVEDAWERLIRPSIEREVRSELTERAEEQALKIFSANLRNLLLQPPVKGKVVLGLDPAYRTGCKIAVVDETGKVLDTAVIYPTPPQNKIDDAKKVMKQLIEKYNVDIISIGNGTASRESEIFVADLLKEIDRDVSYIVVNESGASVYSASKLGAEEFPDFDVALRSAVSIARRLQDPLAELVKIDPKSIGVGQYQHDIDQKRLGENLSNVVEDCVNSVGVDLNTASVSLLSYVSGINSAIAKNIIEYRENNGKFTDRKQLLNVKKLGEKTFEQCAGFLRIPEAENFLDNTAVHPESYEAALKLLNIIGYSLEDLKKKKKLDDIEERVKKEGYESIAGKIGIGVPTLKDIVNELMKPGRDPRDEMPKPIFSKDILTIEQLKPGMVLEGTVRNVAAFGAFVDIGVHQDGLVHISEMSSRYIGNPLEFISVGDIVKVKVIDVDVNRKRISLSMKDVE